MWKERQLSLQLITVATSRQNQRLFGGKNHPSIKLPWTAIFIQINVSDSLKKMDYSGVFQTLGVRTKKTRHR